MSDEAKHPRLSGISRHLRNQGSRVVLLVCIIALSGIAVGYAAGYPLRWINYQPSNAVTLDQSALAGKVDVDAALVSADDLGAGWVAGDPALGSFGVLGADVCGEKIETPTPLSAKEAAVFVNETNGATIIAQALRVDQWKSAQGYINDVQDGLKACSTFYRTNGGKRIKVTSTEVARDAPVTDHVTRRYQSPDGVQEWSMMAVGDVIVAIQYLAPTPPSADFLGDVEKAVLTRIDPKDFAPSGIGTNSDDLSGEGTPSVTTTSTVPTPTTAAVQNGGAADESGGN